MQTMTTKVRGRMVARMVTLALAMALGLGSAAADGKAKGAGEGAGDKAESGKAASTVVVNLNTATPDELMELPGIGETKAQAIVKYRQSRGGFKKVEDLMKVKGIGRKTFQKLKPHLSLKGPGMVGAAATPRRTTK